MQSKQINMNPEPLKITIYKPIHGTYVSIDYRKLKEAVREHKLIELTILGLGTCMVDPIEWYKTAKKDEKRNVNYKTPMRFIYNYAQIKGRYLQAKEMPREQLGLFK